jgi:hypothetical protein
MLYTEDDCERRAKGENNLQSQILISGESDLSEQMMRVFSSASWPGGKGKRQGGLRRRNWRQIFPEKKMALIFQITLGDTRSESKGVVHLLHKKKSTDEIEKTKRKQ